VGVWGGRGGGGRLVWSPVLVLAMEYSFNERIW
jgi:hypothetical protein